MLGVVLQRFVTQLWSLVYIFSAFLLLFVCDCCLHPRGRLNPQKRLRPGPLNPFAHFFLCVSALLFSRLYRGKMAGTVNLSFFLVPSCNLSTGCI